MNAVIYARFSAGPNQTNQSIEGQMRDCMKYAENNNINVVGSYIDRGISGTDFVNRLEFLRMMDDCAKNKFDAIIVWKIDRFGRDRQEIAINKIKLKKHGIKLLYAMEHIPEGPEGIILESLLEGMAEYYSAELSQKVKRGLRESALKGHCLGANHMLGYDIVDKKYKVNPDQAEIVRQIFHEYASGSTATQICSWLKEKGIKSARGNEIRPKTVMQMLRNEKYIGIYKYMDIVLTDAIEPIIDVELWEMVQVQLAMNKKHSSAKRKEKGLYFYFTGMLFCGLCGGSFTGESGTSRNGSTYYYYKCANKKNKNKRCCQKSFRKEYFEEWIIAETAHSVLTDEVIDMIADAVIRIQESDLRNLELERENKRLDEIEKAINNIMKAIESGVISESTVNRMNELEQLKSDQKVRIAKLSIEAPKLTKEQIIFWMQSMLSGDISDDQTKEKIIDTFISKITVFDDHVMVHYNFCEDSDFATRRLELKNLSEQLVRIDGIQQGRIPVIRTSIRNIYVGLYHFSVDISLDSYLAS